MFVRILCLCLYAVAAASGAEAARLTPSTASHVAASSWTVTAHYHEADADVEETAHMPHNMTVAEEDHEDLHHGDLESLELDVDVLRGDEGDEEAHGSEDEVEDFTLAEKFSGIALGRDLLQEHRCYDKCRNCPCPYCCGVTTHSWCGFCLDNKGEKAACVDDLGWYAKNCI